MGEQRLHSALAPLDVLTRLEHQDVMHKELEYAIKARYLGIELQRFPRTTAQASGSTLNLFNGEADIGPESGDFWHVRRIIVKSSSLTDPAKYLVYRGSSPSDITNAYSLLNLIDGFNAPVAAISAPVPSQPAVPATGVAQQNVNQFPVQVVISANGATITNVSVNGVTVGTAAGTYTVPANGAISIAYSVATPTWVWSNLNSSVAAVPMGLNVNVGYYPANKSLWLQPGEQIFASISGATSGNTYALDGEAIRVPAEMKGKLLT